MFDLSTLTSPQRQIIGGTLAACDYDFSQLKIGLKAQTGKDLVPVEFADLSRYSRQLHVKERVASSITDSHHWHVQDGDDTAHVLGFREAPLGLAWYSGKVSVAQHLENDPKFAAEVFLSEGAHMVDFFAMTPSQREAIFKLYHPGMSDVELRAHGHGWFEETGNQDYWSWVGESFMAGFCMAFAPTIELRMPASQPWHHPTTPAIATAIRSILAPPPPAGGPTPQPPAIAAWGRKRGHVYHVCEHFGVKHEITWLTIEAAVAAGRHRCYFCKIKPC